MIPVMGGPTEARYRTHYSSSLALHGGQLLRLKRAKKKPTRTDWRWRHCVRKVMFRTLEAAEVEVARRVKRVIYHQIEPQAYQCSFGKHFHVGHGLKRR